jgi:hypothetical protein
MQKERDNVEIVLLAGGGLQIGRPSTTAGRANASEWLAEQGARS